MFHVGFGKTGTSAIQQALRENTGRFKEQGVFCCDLWLIKRTVGVHGFENHEQFLQLLNSNPVEFSRRLARIFSPENPSFEGTHTIIWSNETLAMHWATVGAIFGELPQSSKNKVVVYLRNQVDWLISAYLQWGIKDKNIPGRVRTWEAFCRDSRNSTDYLAILKNWTGHCHGASVVARSYDTANDIVSDFFGCLQLKAEIKPSVDRVYETPNYTALSLFKVFNDQFQEAKQPEPLLGLMTEAGVVSRDFHAVDPCLIDVSADMLNDLAETFSEMNNQLQKDYGVELKYSGRSRFLGRRDNATEDNTDLIAALLLMILHLERKSSLMENTLNALSRRLAAL